MKKLLPLLLVIILAACSNEKNYVTVSGQVENPASTTIEVFYYTDQVIYSTEKVEVELDENNSFNVTLPLTESQHVYVRHGSRNITLYLSPGAEVNVAFDAAQADSRPVITGEKALESKFFVDYTTDVGSKYSGRNIWTMSADMSPEEFKQFADDIYKERLEYLHNYEGYDKLDKDFVTFIEKESFYGKYVSLLDYPRVNSAKELPAGYYDFLEEENLFNDQYIASRNYNGFVSSWLNYQTSLLDRQDQGISYSESRYELARELLTGKTRDRVLTDAMIMILNFGDFEKAQGFYADYTSVVTTAQYQQIIDEEYNKVLSLSPGNPAPAFTLTDIDGQEVSLSDFAGKVVYLDFWASWCGPCMREMPHAKELKKRMADHDDLVYLYVSVDTDEAAWRKTVEQHDIQGVHVNVPGFGHEVPEGYNLKGVPTFYIIGRDGNIYDNRPPRPSNELIDQVLLSALEQNL